MVCVVSWEGWLRKAGRFRDYARSDLTSGRLDSAAFFAQQSAEFLLKALLIMLTGSRPLTHSIAELLSLLNKALGRDAPADVARCSEELEQHYVQARYPDARINEYRPWEAQRAVECMEVIWSYVQGLGVIS